MNQEEDPASSAATSDDQLRRINSQLGLDVASKLGFVDAKDLVSSEDLQVQVRADTLFLLSLFLLKLLIFVGNLKISSVAPSRGTCFKEAPLIVNI